MTPEEQQQAAFAARFKGTTNLAQRRRHQEILDQYDSQRAQESQQQYERALGAAEMSNPLKAEANRIGQQRESRMRGEAIMREDRFLRQEDEAKRRFELQQEVARKKLELDQSKFDIAQEKALREMDDAKRILNNTNNLERADFELRQNKFLPGTPGYAAGIAAAIGANPYAKPDFVKSLAGQARIEEDPENLILNYPGEGKPQVYESIGPDGRKSFRLTPPVEPKPVKTLTPEQEKMSLEKEHKFLTDEFNATKDPTSKESLNPPLTKHYEERLNEVRKKLYELDKTQATPVAPAAPTTPAISVGAAPTASVGQQATPAPQAETAPVFKTVFKDGKLVPVE